MTIEEITSAVRAVLINTNDYDPYAEGYQDAIFWVLDMLDTLGDTYPWHQYPKEKPPKDGYYLVTWGYEVPIVAKFEKRKFCLQNVKAWAELPALYKEERDGKKKS